MVARVRAAVAAVRFSMEERLLIDRYSELVEDLAEVCFADDTLLVPLFDDVEPCVLLGCIMELYAHVRAGQ